MTKTERFSVKNKAKKHQAWWFLMLFGALNMPFALQANETTESIDADNAMLELIPEQRLMSGLSAIQQAQFANAEAEIEQLAQAMPRYKLAQLMKADMYAIKAGQTDLISQYRQVNPKTTKALLSEAKVRWDRADHKQVNEHHQALLNQYVLKASDEPYLVIVDSAAHRLYLYQQGQEGYEAVVNYYVSIGRKGTGKQVRGDLKTPIGVYSIVKELADRELPELYGVGALTLDYPNAWDKQQGRTGSGIWLHGTPRDTFSRAPLASRGCVVLNNPEMQMLISKYHLKPSAPIILTESSLEPVLEEESVLENKQTVLSQINQWLRNQPDYQVDWANVSVYAYPGVNDLFYVRFPLKDGQYIQQYWRRNGADQNWQMVLESETLQTHKAANLS